jgi:5-methylphenazine-1-carboxylate 1-monooxygenase
MRIAIVGGGIGGLTLALALQHVKYPAEITIYEAVPEIKPVGAGINLGPHAMKELSALGLEAELSARGCLPQDYAFFTRLGQLVYREPWGRAAGHQWPHLSIHRADLHEVMMKAVVDRLGPGRLETAHRCTGFAQDETGVIVHLETPDGAKIASEKADILIACDGVHSAVRKQLFPNEGPFIFRGVNLWRGVTRHRPILTGASIARIGARHTTMILYPIRNDIDATGDMLINWVVEVEREVAVPVDWSKPGRLEDFYHLFQDWTFEWLDAAALIRASENVFSYPMVDRDPLLRWTHGRVTLLGDAAHPMYPQGGNGGAQSIIDAATLARLLMAEPDAPAALAAYEATRLPATSRIVVQNRTAPPNVLVDAVEQRTNGKPFDKLDDVISQDELRAIFERYQKVAGYHVDQVGKTSA